MKTFDAQSTGVQIILKIKKLFTYYIHDYVKLIRFIRNIIQKNTNINMLIKINYLPFFILEKLSINVNIPLTKPNEMTYTSVVYFNEYNYF